MSRETLASGKLSNQPIHAFEETQSGQSAAAHDLPFPLAQVGQSECFRDLGGCLATLFYR